MGVPDFLLASSWLVFQISSYDASIDSNYINFRKIPRLLDLLLLMPSYWCSVLLVSAKAGNLSNILFLFWAEPGILSR